MGPGVVEDGLVLDKFREHVSSAEYAQVDYDTNNKELIKMLSLQVQSISINNIC